MAVGTDGTSVGIVHHNTERTVERLCPGVRARGRVDTERVAFLSYQPTERLTLVGIPESG